MATSRSACKPAAPAIQRRARGGSMMPAQLPRPRHGMAMRRCHRRSSSHPWQRPSRCKGVPAGQKPPRAPRLQTASRLQLRPLHLGVLQPQHVLMQQSHQQAQHVLRAASLRSKPMQPAAVLGVWGPCPGLSILALTTPGLLLMLLLSHQLGQAWPEQCWAP